jgi:hypothetical protein
MVTDDSKMIILNATVLLPTAMCVAQAAHTLKPPSPAMEHGLTRCGFREELDDYRTYRFARLPDCERSKICHSARSTGNRNATYGVTVNTNLL